jgi:hypothetical protein
MEKSMENFNGLTLGCFIGITLLCAKFMSILFKKHEIKDVLKCINEEEFTNGPR